MLTYVMVGKVSLNNCIIYIFTSQHQIPESCQSYNLAPSTGHVMNCSTSIILLMQGDKGGERVLQKKWTTFLKAQLLCSLPDDGFPFNIIQDMFVLTPSAEDWKNTVFYGVFTSQW